MSARRGVVRDEQGASLLLVLVFITSLSLVIGALLFGSSTAQLATVVTTTLADATYAADSGVEHGIEQLRLHGGFCPAEGGPLKVTNGTTTMGSNVVSALNAGFTASDVSLKISGGSIPLGSTIVSVTSISSVTISAPALANGTGNVTLTVERPAPLDLPPGVAAGQAPSVTCSGANAEYTPQGVSAWAIVTLDPGDDSLATQSGGGSDKQISGPTYVSGKFNLQAPLQANETTPDPTSPTYPVGDGNGLVFQSTGAVGGCVRPSSTDLITTNFACTTMAPPDPLPPLPPKPGDALSPVNVGPCRIFKPGRYTSLALGSQNYFASGIYYFDDLGRIDLGSKQVFGGAVDTASGDKRALTAVPCSDDVAAGVTTGDKGVHIILGGTSWLDINKADAEFMSYHPAGGNTAGRGISIRTVPSTGYGLYKPSTAGNADKKGLALTVAPGNNPHFAVHGLVYSPNASVSLNDDNTSASEILGGVLAWDLSVRSSASAQSLVIQVTGGRPQSRSAVVIEASVPVSGTKNVKAHAVVDVHVSRTVTDGTTTFGSDVVGSATAQFSKADEGVTICSKASPSALCSAATGIPLGARILNFLTTSSVRISANATSSGTGRTLDIDAPFRRSVTDGTTTINSTTVRSNTAAFTDVDVDGTIAGTGIPGGTAGSKIVKVVDGTTIEISNPATGTGSALALTIVRRKIVRVTVDSWRVDNP